MNQILANIVNAFTNLHVSIPTVLGAGLGIAGIVWPQYQAKFTAIAVVLISYGIIGAANTPASAQTPATATTVPTPAPAPAPPKP
jgi:hypothetical protein